VLKQSSSLDTGDCVAVVAKDFNPHMEITWDYRPAAVAALPEPSIRAVLISGFAGTSLTAYGRKSRPALRAI